MTDIKAEVVSNGMIIFKVIKLYAEHKRYITMLKLIAAICDIKEK